MISLNSTNKINNPSQTSVNSFSINNQSDTNITNIIRKIGENELNNIDQPLSICNISNKNTNNYEIVEYENPTTNNAHIQQLNQSSQVSQIDYHNNIPSCNFFFI
jgi:hypothetical protein